MSKLLQSLLASANELAGTIPKVSEPAFNYTMLMPGDSPKKYDILQFDDRYII